MNTYLPAKIRALCSHNYWAVKLLAWSPAILVALLGAGTAYGQPPPPVDFEDGTGRIRMRVKTCEWREGTNPCAGCIVDEGWSMVGGGAEIQGQPDSVRLQKNVPWEEENCPGEQLESGSTWFAESSGPSSHQLRAYVVGLQLVDRNGQVFAPEVFMSSKTTGIQGPGSTTLECMDHNNVNKALTFIGAGAQITDGPTLLNGYLTESRPFVAQNGEVGLRASGSWPPGQDENLTGVLKCWILGLELCPEQWVYEDPMTGEEIVECLSYPRVSSLQSAPSFGLNTVNSTISSSWIPTTVGGQPITQSGQERYLDDLIPLDGQNRGFTVSSKPGDDGGAGATLGSALVIGMLGAPYNYNAIRFNTAGTALSAFPFGGDDRLWQTNQYPLSDWAHWYLDPISSTVPTAYLLRNGNPDEGDECAYWAGDNDVRVAECEASTGAFHWVKMGDNVFQLKNAESQTCLDNGDRGFVPAALTLEPCNNGYSPEQSLFLDAYDWPTPAVEQNSPFRFEELSYWNSSASLALDSVVKTDGESGLSVGGSGYRVVNSVPVGTPLAGFGSTLLLDVYVPGEQPNPYWLGAVQVYASCPEAEMNNAYLGQSELTGLPTEAFSTLEYPLPEEIREVLSQNRDDCFFSVAVNMNATPEDPVLDNLRFIP